MALASTFGDRLSGFIACVVLASFRWYIGLLFFIGWAMLRPPLRRLLAERATLMRRATPELRHSWYYIGCSYRPEFAKEVRVFGLGGWILGRHRGKWLAGMEPAWRQMRHFRHRTLLFGAGVAAMYVAGAGAIALAAWHRDISLATVAVMLPMLPTTMQVGGVSPADVGLEQMRAAVPDLDDLVSRLGPGPAGEGRASAAGRPVSGIRFGSVTYRYPGGGRAVCQGLDLELTAGRSLALVGANGAGKTTLVTVLARLREPSEGRITVDGTDLRDLDTHSWQCQVAVVNQDFGRYPLSARENVAFCDLTGDGLSGDFDGAAP
ncbi:MAG: ATP-binding cassette domain-containing protein [Streptosporangiaceae bacterium]